MIKILLVLLAVKGLIFKIQDNLIKIINRITLIIIHKIRLLKEYRNKGYFFLIVKYFIIKS